MSYFKNVRSCFDANHNKLSEAWTGAMADWSFVTTNGGTYTSGYDAEDRFRNFIQTAKSKSLYLDRSDIGNITNYQMNSVNAYRSYSNIHALTSVDGSSQTFNSDGQLTGSYYGHTLSWDEAGMLRQVDVPSSPSVGVAGENRYGYDATQRRIFKEITRDESVAEHRVYIHAGPNLIAEYTAGTAAASPSQEYVYSQEIDSLVLLVRNGGSDKYTITRNQQWSVTALAELSSGTVVERYTYDAFGKRTILAADGSTVRTTSSYNMPFGYTSRQHDPETGLMYFRARYYDPLTGEFISPDPLEYVDGMSLYRGYFVINAVDPTGAVIAQVNCQQEFNDCIASANNSREWCRGRGRGICFVACVGGVHHLLKDAVQDVLKRVAIGMIPAFACEEACFEVYSGACDLDHENLVTCCNRSLNYCNANREWPGWWWRFKNCPWI